MADGQQGLIVVDDSEPSKTRVFFMRVFSIGATITAVAVATSLAYFMFQGIRKTRLDNVMDDVLRSVGGVLRSLFDMDVYVYAWALPMILGLIIVVGMLVYRHFDR